jgi:hypothetical protein
MYMSINQNDKLIDLNLLKNHELHYWKEISFYKWGTYLINVHFFSNVDMVAF